MPCWPNSWNVSQLFCGQHLMIKLSLHLINSNYVVFDWFTNLILVQNQLDKHLPYLPIVYLTTIKSHQTTSTYLKWVHSSYIIMKLYSSWLNYDTDAHEVQNHIANAISYGIKKYWWQSLMSWLANALLLLLDHYVIMHTYSWWDDVEHLYFKSAKKKNGLYLWTIVLRKTVSQKVKCMS